MTARDVHGHADGRLHRHDDDHGGHSHGMSADADKRWLTIALALIAGFMVVEVAVGLIASSLALLSDAAHMLTDAASIVLALVAIRLAARPARGRYTFGLKRAEILSAQANGLTLLILAAWLCYEAIRRLIHPLEVRGWLVVITAVAGIGVNLAASWSLSRANRTSLNVEGAFQHILNDLFAFVATAIAGVIMVVTGFNRADAIASLIVVVLMVKAGVGLVRESGRILLEAAPAGLHPDMIGDALVTSDGVVEVHDLHVWTITSGQPALSAHVLVEPGRDCHQIRNHLESLLRDDYQLTHTTLQVDHAGSDLLRIGETVHCEDAHGPAHTNAEHRH